MADGTMDLGGGGNAFPFDKIGDKVRGKIVDFAERQQTDMDTGEPDFWPDGKPKMMIWVELQTQLRNDDSDDGKRSVYVRGSKKPESCSSMAAVAGAVKKATAGSALRLGDEMELEFFEEGEPSKRGWNAPKRYKSQYWPKGMQVGEPDPTPPPTAGSAHQATGGTAEPAVAGMLSPEQIAALFAAQAKPVDPIAAHPQGAQLRAAGIPDDAIKAALGIA